MTPESQTAENQPPGIGLSLLGYDLSSRQMAEIGRQADGSTLDSLWTGDYFRDGFVQATILGLATERIQVGTGISQGFVRTPLAAALAALDLDELTGGRFSLGLGSQVKVAIERWHGLPFSQPAARLADCARAIRAAMGAGGTEPARYEGPFYKLDLTGHVRSPVGTRRIPIHMAAAGPRMLAAARETVDGVLGHIFWSPRYLDDVVYPTCLAHTSPFEIRVTTLISLSDDEATARREARLTLGFYAGTGTYQHLLAADGFGEESRRAREALLAKDEPGIVDAVSDTMLFTYAMAGTADQVRDQWRARSASRPESLLLLPAWYRTPASRILEQVPMIIDVFGSEFRPGPPPPR